MGWIAGKGTYVNNRATETPTHFCWLCKKIFLFPDNRRDAKCLSPECNGAILLAYFDDDPYDGLAQSLINAVEPKTLPI